jgi:hypothetical protein
MLTRSRRPARVTEASGSLLGPPALALEHDRVRIGAGGRVRQITGYPREVSRGWLLHLHAARDVGVALHIEAVRRRS